MTRGNPNCDDHDGFGPNGECSTCTGLIQKDNGVLIDLDGNVVQTVTYPVEFIRQEFTRYQRSGCREQTVRDNMPFFVESLLSRDRALTARLTVLAGALRNIGDASVALDPEPFRKFVQRTVTEALGAER